MSGSATECGGCGGQLARLEVGLCRLCRSIWTGNPEHIRPIVDRVMDEIKPGFSEASSQKDAA